MTKSHQATTRKLVLSALFIAIGLLLPFLTGQIREIGNKLLPMHIPVLLCGLVCGWQYGGAVGFIVPLLRSLLFGMPLLYPNAIAMAFELCAYGLIAGIVYSLFKKQNVVAVYVSLITAMIGGRIIWGIAEIILLGIDGGGFTAKMFVTGAFINAVPGIIVQLVLIPAIMSALNASGVHSYRHR